VKVRLQAAGYDPPGAVRKAKPWSWLILGIVVAVWGGGISPLTVRAADLTIHLAGLRSTSGQLRLSLYDRDEKFLKAEGRIARLKVPVQSNPMTVHFTGLPPGTYAVTVHHDEDGDGKLNRNLLGLPREGYGFSNDAHGALGPPPFTNAAVQLDAEVKVIAITMRY
jgi:uncharacterized protein (DUF2141 family)